MESLLNGLLEDDRNQMSLAYKCLSCGQSSLHRKRAAGGNPFDRPEHENANNDDLSLASMDTRALRSRGGQSREASHKHDENTALIGDLKFENAKILIGNELRGELNPVNPPLKHQYLKKNSQDATPLYRRARNASYLKEVIKIPTQVPTTASKAQLYHLDDEIDSTDASSVHSRSLNGLDSRWNPNPLSRGKPL
jgi:hypothetical protein